MLLAACAGDSGSPAPDNESDDLGGIQPIPCSVSVSDGPFTQTWPDDVWQASSPEAQGLCPDEVADALDYAFVEGNDTGAVLIIRNGYIVAERYDADRFAIDQVTSWSVAKSFTSALIGAAVDAGSIGGLDQSLAEFIPAWAGTDKADVTLRHLLTLRTALELLDDDDGDGFPDGLGLYSSNDQLALSLARPLAGTPGDRIYTYSNSDVLIAGEVIRASTGMSANSYLSQGIGNAIGFDGEWWTDGTGHVMSYCCLDATPRKFARFGLLFAREGEWNGTQVLSEAWIDESTSPARGGTYGFYWWPLDDGGFAAFGLMGQMIAIYPEDDLVILRFGNYQRMGNGHPIREFGNYHRTTEPDDFESDFSRPVFGRR